MIRKPIQLFLLGVLYATGVSAQAPATSGLTLAAAIREAQSSHPALQAAEARIRSAEGLRTQAGLGLNPRLVVQSENTRFWETPAFKYWQDSDTFLYATQILETAGKRQRRVELAEAGVQVASLERSVLQRQIAARVSLAYWIAVAAARSRDLLQESVDTYERIVQYHRDRVREGAMAEVDLLRVLLERDRLVVQVLSATEEYRQAVIVLQREMGRTQFRSALQLTDSLAEVRELAEPDLKAVLLARPELDATRAAVQRAQAGLRLQQAVASPDPEVLFGYKRTAGFNTLIGGLQINLPVRNRNEGQIASAGAEIRVAENHVRALESQIRAEVESAWSAYQSRRQLLTETLGPMQQRAGDIAKIALAAYQEGGFDLLRLIDAQRARLEAMSLYYRALSEYQQSVTTLQIVTGAQL
ncbi:MAG: TolC family protein [Bryobacteraceae bacterium]|nr:TolC family protein [Bryobacteraceae bacterium]